MVYADGRWHVFASIVRAAATTWCTLNFTDWSQAASATHLLPRPVRHRHRLPGRAAGVLLRAAEPVVPGLPDRATPRTRRPPTSATRTRGRAPKNFYSRMPQIIRDNIGNGYWVDMWVDLRHGRTATCSPPTTTATCTGRRPPLANFPNGFTNTVIAMQDSDQYRLFEAANVYRVAGQNQYLLMVEAIGTDGRRYFRSWTAAVDHRARGRRWPTPRPTRSPGPTTSPSRPAPWTRDISHGEMVRAGTDQTMRSARATSGTSTRAWTPTPAATTTACPGGSACSPRPTRPADTARARPSRPPAAVGHEHVRPR